LNVNFSFFKAKEVKSQIKINTKITAHLFKQKFYLYVIEAKSQYLKIYE